MRIEAWPLTYSVMLSLGAVGVLRIAQEPGAARCRQCERAVGETQTTAGCEVEAFGADLHSVEAATVGGLVLELLGRPAEVGDRVEADSLSMTVDETDGSRVAVVLVSTDREPEAAS